jgi:hypothetical protein
MPPFAFVSPPSSISSLISRLPDRIISGLCCKKFKGFAASFYGESLLLFPAIVPVTAKIHV